MPAADQLVLFFKFGSSQLASVNRDHQKNFCKSDYI